MLLERILMEELLQAANTRVLVGGPGLEDVRAICALLEEHKGSGVTALDLRELNSWTDFFVIATVLSGVHLQGLMRHILEYADRRGLAVFHRSRLKSNDGGGWNLVDMGTIVIHLMTTQSREFYELEELWGSAVTIYPYSSKSS